LRRKGKAKEIYQPQGEDKNRKHCKNVDDFENPMFYVTLTGKFNDCTRY